MNKKPLLYITLLMALSACGADLQYDYESVSDGCRTDAEVKASKLGPARNEATRNAELVALFSDCMAREGWAVATPQRERGPSDTIIGNNNSFSNNPNSDQIPQNNGRPTTASSTATAGSVNQTPTVSTGPDNTAAANSTYTPPPPSPAPAPIPQPTSPGYSVYQPAYPTPAPDVTPPATDNNGFNRF